MHIFCMFHLAFFTFLVTEMQAQMKRGVGVRGPDPPPPLEFSKYTSFSIFSALSGVIFTLTLKKKFRDASLAYYRMFRHHRSTILQIEILRSCIVHIHVLSTVDTEQPNLRHILQYTPTSVKVSN